MSVTFRKWHRLGKKTFWLTFLKSVRFYVVLFGLGSFITYKAVFTPFKNSFQDFFINQHPELYLTPNFVIGFIWLFLFLYFLFVWLRAWILYRQYKFMLDEHAFYVHRGVFLIKEIVIPYHHIQNVEIKQPYLYRPFGLAELDITTLGNNGSIAQDIAKHKSKSNLLPIIDLKIAKLLARELVRRGSHKEGAFVVEEKEGDNLETELR